MSLSDNREASSQHATFPRMPIAQPQFAAPKPLYSQVRDMLTTQISTGHWSPGAALPNESVLAQRFGVSIGTIRRAVEGLEDMGIVTRRQGRGTFVAGLGLSGTTDRLCRLRGASGEPRLFSRKMLTCERRKVTTEEAIQFRVEVSRDLLEVSIGLFIDATTIGIERSLVPAKLAADVEAGLAQGRDLYALLGDDGAIVTRAQDAVSATIANKGDCHDLGIAKGQPVLQVIRRTFAISDHLVELRIGRYDQANVSYLSMAQ